MRRGSRSSFALVRPALLSGLLAVLASNTPVQAQQTPPARRPAAGSDTASRPRRQVKINQARAESLYVSTDPADNPPRNFERDIAAKARTDSIYAARSRGVMQFSKVQYRSRAGDMDVPAYLFTPLNQRGARGHAAMVWVHGGVHGDWNENMLPFVVEAVQRGYVVITPDYRGSNGYGAAHYNAIDYGGKELDDVMAAYDYLKTLPYVDPDRVGSWAGATAVSSRRISLWLRSRESGIAGTGNGEPRLRVESLFPVPRSQARAKRATDSLFPIPDSRFPISLFPMFRALPHDARDHPLPIVLA